MTLEGDQSLTSVVRVPPIWMLSLLFSVIGIVLLFVALYIQAGGVPSLPSIGYEVAVGLGIGLIVVGLGTIATQFLRVRETVFCELTSAQFNELSLDLLKDVKERVVHLPGWNVLLLGPPKVAGQDDRPLERVYNRLHDLAEKSAAKGRPTYLCSYILPATSNEIQYRNKQKSLGSQAAFEIQQRVQDAVRKSDHVRIPQSAFELRVPQDEAEGVFRFLVVDSTCLIWTMPPSGDTHEGRFSVILAKNRPELAETIVSQFNSLRPGGSYNTQTSDAAIGHHLLRSSPGS